MKLGTQCSFILFPNLHQILHSQVDLSVINGEVVVRGGVLKTLDVAALVAEHNRRSAHICSHITDSANAEKK